MKLPKGFGQQGFGGYMDQMKTAMARAQNLEAELAHERLQVVKGPVTVVFDGTGQLQSLKLEKSAVDPDDLEMLEDLIVGAVRDGFNQATELRSKKMNEIMPNVPGITDMMG